MKEIEDVLVKEVMTSDVVSVTPETTVRELRELFERYDFNSFPVVSGDKLVGIVSKLDFLKIFTMGTGFSRSGYWKLFAEMVGEIMRKAVVSISPDDDIKLAVEYMVEFNLRSLPVTEGERLVGIISRKDVIRHLVVE